MAKWLLPLLLIGAAIYIGAKTLSDKVSYKIKSVSLKGISLSNISFDIVLSIINPTNIPVTVKSIFADLSYNGITIANAKMNTETIIAAAAVTNIRLQAQAPTFTATKNLYSIIQDLISKKNTPVFNITGTIQLDQGSLTIATQQKVELT